MSPQPREQVSLLFAACLGFVFVAVLFSHFYFNYSFITSDAYERARSAQYLISAGYPVESSAIGAGPTSYPPFFDVFLAAFSQLFGLPVSASTNALSFIFATMFFCLGYLLARAVLSELGRPADEAVCCLGGIALFLSPWIYYRTITPISETLGLVLCFLAVYAFYKRASPWLVFSILAALSLSHFRSFMAAMICLGVLVLFGRRVKELIFESFVATAIFIYFVPRTALGFENPFVVTPGVFEFFSLPLLVTGVAGAALLVFSRKIPALVAALLAAPVVLSAFAPFSFRQLPYLALPLAAMSAFFLSSLRAMVSGRAFRVAFFCGLALAAICFNSFTTWRSAPLDEQSQAVVTQVAQYPQQNVYAGFAQSYAIPCYSPQKKVVLGSFAEELPDFKSRIYVAQSVMGGTLDSTARAIMDIYGVGLVVANYSAEGDPLGLGGERLLQSDSYSAYSISN
jgi:hypothetical protein